MNSRERVLRTVGFQETDRIALDIDGRISDLMQYYSVGTKEGLYKLLGIDIWGIDTPFFKYYTGAKRFYKGCEADVWGIPLSSDGGDANDISPLAEVRSIDEVEAYEWPSSDHFDYSYINMQLEEHRDFFIVGGTWAPLFHNFSALCGFENSLVYLMTEPEIAKAILRNVTNFWIAQTRKTLQCGRGRIDAVFNCNDFGTQRGLIMDPEVWRDLIKPELKRFYKVIKEYGAKVLQHSCGSIVEIIPDLIEIGADILDPIQVKAEGMDPESLGEKFGGKIAFHGGIDTQHVLPEGSDDDVRSEVRRVVRALNNKGGYILCGSQTYMDDIPLKNIVALYDEAAKLSGRIT